MPDAAEMDGVGQNVVNLAPAHRQAAPLDPTRADQPLG